MSKRRCLELYINWELTEKSVKCSWLTHTHLYICLIIMLFIPTQMSFFPRREVDLITVRNPVDGFSIFIKLILPGPGFEPVSSRVAGRWFPCILNHLNPSLEIYFRNHLDFMYIFFDNSHFTFCLIRGKKYWKSWTKNWQQVSATLKINNLTAQYCSFLFFNCLLLTAFCPKL